MVGACDRRCRARRGLAIAGLAPALPAMRACRRPRRRATRETSTTVRCTARPLVLHLAAPAVPGPTPPAALVLYASGDGGWFGTAVQMFRVLAAGGQPAVGLSSRAFLKIERPGQRPAEPGAVAPRLCGHPRSRASGARAAARHARDPDRLVARRGVRGPRRRRARTVAAAPAGVVAIGLDDGEDLAIDGPEDETDDERRPIAPTIARAGALARPGAAPFAPYDDARARRRRARRRRPGDGRRLPAGAAGARAVRRRRAGAPLLRGARPQPPLRRRRRGAGDGAEPGAAVDRRGRRRRAGAVGAAALAAVALAAAPAAGATRAPTR